MLSIDLKQNYGRIQTMLIGAPEIESQTKLFGNAKAAKEAIQYASKVILEGFIRGTYSDDHEFTNDMVHRQALQEASINCTINGFTNEELLNVREIINAYFLSLKYRGIKIVLFEKFVR